MKSSKSGTFPWLFAERKEYWGDEDGRADGWDWARKPVRDDSGKKEVDNLEISIYMDSNILAY